MEQNMPNIPTKQKTRKKLVSVILFIIIFGIIVVWVGLEYNAWWKVRKEYVRMGFAEDKFPYRMYTERELVEKGLWSGESPALNAVPTRTTPEETYAIFRQALIDGDLDKAAECFIENYREEWRKSLYEIKDKGLLPEMLRDLPERLEDTYIYNDINNRNLSGESSISYDYAVKKNGKNYSHVMSFIKNWDGDWKIERL